LQPMIGVSWGDDATFFAGAVLSLAMVVYIIRVCIFQRQFAVMWIFVCKLSKDVYLRRFSTVDEVGRIVQEKTWQQKVGYFCVFGKLMGVLLSPFTANMMFKIAAREMRMHTPVQDIVLLLGHGTALLCLFRPKVVSARTLDVFYIFVNLGIAIYVSAWVCRAEFMLEALMIANFIAIAMTTVRRSLLVCGSMNAVITASACGVLWVHRDGCTNRPLLMMFAQACTMTFITVGNQMFDMSVMSMLRQDLEARGAKEVLSAANALLKSCCDIVVKLDSEGKIIGPARDLGSFLLRGPRSSLQGIQLADLMATKEDRLFFVGKLDKPWSSDASIAEVRHVHMKDGNGEHLSLELLWFQFRHLDQQRRYMVGLKEFTDPALRRPPLPSAVRRAELPQRPSARADLEVSGSIPEASSVVADNITGLPVLVVVDCTKGDCPVLEVSDEFCKRIGRLSPGQSLTQVLKRGEVFQQWLQLAVQTSVYELGAVPDCSLVFMMVQGEMTATCRLALNADAESSGAALDMRSVRLSFSNIRRHCSSGTASDRSCLKGTPVKRLGL